MNDNRHTRCCPLGHGWHSFTKRIWRYRERRRGRGREREGRVCKLVLMINVTDCRLKSLSYFNNESTASSVMTTESHQRSSGKVTPTFIAYLCVMCVWVHGVTVDIWMILTGAQHFALVRLSSHTHAGTIIQYYVTLIPHLHCARMRAYTRIYARIRARTT